MEKTTNEIGAAVYTDLLEKYLLEDDFDLDNSIRKSALDRQKFSTFLANLSAGTAEEQALYKQYLYKKEFEKKDLTNDLLLLIYYICNGIEKNGIKTNFSLLDFYEIFNVNPKSFMSKMFLLPLTGDFSAANRENALRYIEAMIQNRVKLTEEQALEYKYSYNGTVLDDETKRELIRYIESIGAPLDTCTFSAACESVIKGTITLNKVNLNKI